MAPHNAEEMIVSYIENPTSSKLAKGTSGIRDYQRFAKKPFLKRIRIHYSKVFKIPWRGISADRTEWEADFSTHYQVYTTELVGG